MWMPGEVGVIERRITPAYTAGRLGQTKNKCRTSGTIHTAWKPNDCREVPVESAAKNRGIGGRGTLTTTTEDRPPPYSISGINPMIAVERQLVRRVVLHDDAKVGRRVAVGHVDEQVGRRRGWR